MLKEAAHMNEVEDNKQRQRHLIREQEANALDSFKFARLNTTLGNPVDAVASGVSVVRHVAPQKVMVLETKIRAKKRKIESGEAARGERLPAMQATQNQPTKGLHETEIGSSLGLATVAQGPGDAEHTTQARSPLNKDDEAPAAGLAALAGYGDSDSD